ncbi:MAG: hypothetical protein LBB49_00440 [Gracilibacteraceae bacterium]|jgi:hypothetical protein|nr:hypothetical protein [Gracilibacteraceae bacterium]
MNFEGIKRLLFVTENLNNDYVSWDIEKEPTSPRFEYENLTENDYHFIIQAKTRLDEMMYKAVLDYVNDDNLCNCHEGNFPRSDRMTGNFYVVAEYYCSYGEKIQGYISTHFTEMFSGGVIIAPVEQDYLGLEVGFIINYDGKVEITSIDSSSI